MGWVAASSKSQWHVSVSCSAMLCCCPRLPYMFSLASLLMSWFQPDCVQRICSICNHFRPTVTPKCTCKKARGCGRHMDTCRGHAMCPQPGPAYRMLHPLAVEGQRVEALLNLAALRLVAVDVAAADVQEKLQAARPAEAQRAHSGRSRSVEAICQWSPSHDACMQVAAWCDCAAHAGCVAAR